jgi:ABC-type nitrate/sulfonate/bicarbonate transport system substrate-binding protein
VPSVVGRASPPATAVPPPGRFGRVSIALDGEPWVVQAGLFLARERGYYQDAGIDPYFHVVSSREAALRALVAGQDELALVGGLDLVRARSEGTAALSLMPIAPRPLVALLARQGVIGRPRDLAGRRVVMPDDPLARTVVEAIMRGDGLDPARLILQAPGSDPIGALLAGQLEAVGGYIPREGPAIEARGGQPVGFRPEQFGVPEYEEIVLAASDGARARRGDALQAFVNATLRGYVEAGRDPRAAADALIRADSDLDRRALERGLPELAPAWAAGFQADPKREERWRAVVKFLADRGLAKADLDPKQLYTDDLLPRPATLTPAPPGPTPRPGPTAPPKPPAAQPKPADAPTKPPEAPAKPAEAPTKPADAPPKPVEVPTKPAEAPTKPVDAPPKPAEVATKPAEVPTKPAEAPPKPLEPVTKPPGA